MSFVRIRLTFQHSLPHTEVKNCWFLFDTSSCSTIADLEYLIRKRFKGPSKSCHVVNLFLDDFLLPSQEKIEIIQNNDHIRVEIQQTTGKQTDEDGRDEQTENKVERKRKKSSLPDARDKLKKKQVEENKQGFSTKKIKGNHLPKKRVRDDSETPKDSKRAKREQKLVRKEAKKEANRRHKSKLSSVVESDVGALLLQERSSTKVFSPSLTSTGTTSSQMKKLNKPSKGKSAIQQKQMNEIKLSLQGDIHKRKEPSVPLKTSSKKGKTSGKVILGGGRNVSDSTSSESSSSIDESGTSNSPSKVKKNGKVTLVGGRNAINSDSTSFESSSSSDESGPSNLPSLTDVAQRRVDTDELKKDAHSIIMETSESQGKNKSDTIPQSSLTLCDITEGTRNGRSFSLSSKASSSLEKSGDSSIFSHKSGKLNSRIESNSKKTLSSLENPASSSRMSFQSPSSAYSQTQTGGANNRSVEQSASGYNAKQMNKSGQVWPLISINGRPNNKPESSQQTSHIRFDSEESEEESIDKQQEDTGLTNGSSEHPLTNAGSTSYFPPCTQSMLPKTPKTAVSESKRSTTQDYSLCTRLHGPPRIGDKIAYKVLELSASYTPEISDYKEGTVLAFDPSSGTVKIELTKESLKKSLGDGNVTGKFELDYDESEENANDEEEETETVVPWNSMIDPVFV
ncbi:coilin-like isoform X2 [Stylophora pistillata]|uniref:coilin-like isoform X2 n=1 Tax=Stylophora pistillata TaxID=50429 RepID=UPI000C03CD0B|nr:coilin-like isoform X2 [Stylophora pistillata]